MSYTDELSLDEPLGYSVKGEVTISMGAGHTSDTTADRSSAQPQLLLHTRLSTKRKRDISSAVESQATSTLPAHVLWRRGFSKISAPRLQSVSGHKNTSTFAAPVKERDTPSYKDLVLRP